MIPSPCIGRCRIDPASKLCAGCARSGAEVAAWRDADPADLARVWADLPRRRLALGITLHRHGWTPDVALAFAVATLQAGSGSWTVGEFGTSILFRADRDRPPTLDAHGATVTAVRLDAALRWDLDDRTRVLATLVPPGRTGTGPERIILAVPKTRDLPEPATSLTPLGPDLGAIRPEDRPAWLFDLGLDRAVTRVALRTHDPDLAAELDRRAGSGWSEVLTGLGDRPGRAPGTAWVVETPLARAEVAASAPSGPLALDPANLALGRATPPGLDLPPTFVPCAIFDPKIPAKGPLALARWVRRLAGRA